MLIVMLSACHTRASSQNYRVSLAMMIWDHTMLLATRLNPGH